MNIARLQMLAAMGIFGSVGIFVHYIPLSPAAIAFCRAVMGLLFMLIMLTVFRRKLSPGALKGKLPVLIGSGAALGLNWVLLFEAYRHTGVAAATACYYFAPMIVVLAAPLLREKLTPKKLLWVGVAFLGMVLVSGVLTESAPDLTGVFFALGAAVLYATVTVLNKRLTDVNAIDRTVVQLVVAAVAVLPYMLVTWEGDVSEMQSISWALLAVVGVVHTGIAYWLYFGAVGKLPAQTVAVFSYLDPVVAIILSALVLQQGMDIYGSIGAVMILGSALLSEISQKKA